MANLVSSIGLAFPLATDDFFIVGRSFNASPRLPVIRSTDTSPINKDISPTATVQNLSIVSEPSSSGSSKFLMLHYIIILPIEFAL